MASLTDIGLELWVLVYHLYTKHINEPQKAFHELLLRTHSTSSENNKDDFSIAKNPSELRHTSWFKKLSDRYNIMRENLKELNQESVKEANEVTRELYPAGCKLQEYIEAMQTCAAMLTSSIPSHALSRFTQHRLEELTTSGQQKISVDELITDLVERLMLDAITPPQWWQSDSKNININNNNRLTTINNNNTILVVKNVGLRVQPTQINILYSWNGKLRQRRIHLSSLLHESGPISVLAKRLTRTHGTLLSEEQFRAYLMRLQKLMRGLNSGKSLESTISHNNTKYQNPQNDKEQEQHKEEKEQNNLNVNMMESTNEKNSTTNSNKGSIGNKADIGLLYRDPDAALNNVDLNDADDITLQEFKAKMDEKFMEKVLRPGDPGYVYDKRIEVKPTERSEWDDSD